VIYLDYNSTVPCKHWESFDAPLNSSSSHYYGRGAKSLLNKSRDDILQVLGGQGYTLSFTASGTESNNLAISQFATLITSNIEHPSVLNVKDNPILVDVDSDGQIVVDSLIEKMQAAKPPFLVSIQHANSETGVIQDIAKLAPIIYQHGGHFHSDCSQSFGKIAVPMVADYITISSHKIGGMLGAAALVYKTGLHLEPLIKGGGQENGTRSGTPNIPAIVSFAKASKNIKYLDINLRDYLESELNVFVNGCNSPRLPNTSNIACLNKTAETQLIYMDINGIAISAGSSCSSGKVGKSKVLVAMGIPEPHLSNSVRVSLGTDTTKEEVDKFVATYKTMTSMNHSAL
jgi:cysteine desulfurase